MWIDEERDDSLVETTINGEPKLPNLVEVTCSVESINYIYDKYITGEKR